MKKILLPIVALLIASTVLIPSCKKKNEPAPTPTPTPTTNNPTGITSKFYFQATINGTVVTYQDGIGGYGSGAGEQSGTTSTGSWQEIQTGVLTKPFSTTNQAGFQIMKDDPSYASTFTEPDGPFVEAMFSVKSYPYGTDHNIADPGVNGAVVFYLDNSGVEWRSDLGSQAGSTFNITEHIANTDGYSFRISKTTFACKLYNSSGGSMTLTNGLCRSRTVTY